jgi:Flp pilus assembly protein TadB
VAEGVRGIDVRLARSLHLGAIAALTFAVLALASGKQLVATVLFIVAAVGFLIVLILQRR